MLEKVINECNVSGKLYGFGRFGLVKDEKDKKIRGSVIVATDIEGLNLVEVNFIPQAEKYGNGKDNNNYKVLERIINEGKTVENVGVNNAFNVRISCSLGSNTFYRANGNNGDLVLAESLQVKGGFIHIDDKAQPACGFNIDCLIKSIEPEVNSEGIETERRIINVDVFDDYRKFFFPLTFKMDIPEGIAFIEREYTPGESYVNLSGTIVNKTIEKMSDPQEEMGFGESAQVNQPRTIREILITGGKSPKDLPMTEEDMATVNKNRSVYLAELKNRKLEKDSQKTNNTSGFTSTTASKTNDVSVNTGSANTYDF